MLLKAPASSVGSAARTSQGPENFSCLSACEVPRLGGLRLSDANALVRSEPLRPDVSRVQNVW